MSKLTREESKWVSDPQDVLDMCRRARLGLYTIGDVIIGIRDGEKSDEVFSVLSARLAADCGLVVDYGTAGFDETITFPNPVESVADQSNRLLLPNEASYLLSDAGAMTSSSFRFGQALWNTLESAYPALADKFRGTEADFYYVIPKQEVIDIFITNFVEQE